MLIDTSHTAAQVAAAVAAAVPNVLQPRLDGSGRISFLSADLVQIDGTLQAGQSNPVPVVGPAGRQILTPNGDVAAAGEVIVVTLPSGPPVFLTYVRSAIDTGVPGEVEFESGQTRFMIAQSIIDELPPGVAFVDPIGNVVFVDPTVTVGILPAPSLVTVTEVPDGLIRTLVDIRPGNELNDDELLSFVYDNPPQTFTVAFDDGDGVPASLVNDAVIPFTDADTTQSILAQLVPLLPVELDPMVIGNTLSVLSNFDAGDDVVDQ